MKLIVEDLNFEDLEIVNDDFFDYTDDIISAKDIPEVCFKENFKDFTKYIDRLMKQKYGKDMIIAYMRYNQDCYQDQKHWDYAMNRLLGSPDIGVIIAIGEHWGETGKVDWDRLTNELLKFRDTIYAMEALEYWTYLDEKNYSRLYNFIHYD